MNIKIFFLKFKKISVIFLILILSFFYLFLNFEIIKAEELGLNSLEMILVPEIPGANEKVKVKLNSYSFDINSSEITIVINNKIIEQEIGLKTFFFTTGDFGNNTELKIIIKKINGGIIEKKYSIIPAEVDLIYELTNPHKPFGYKGKSTLLSNSELTVFAFPSLVNAYGQTIASDSLIYTWYKNFDIELKNSGFGRSTYKIDRLDAFPRETRISVKVSSLDGKIIAKNHITFRPENSEVEFYVLESGLPFNFKNIANPYIFSQTIDTDILAVPYFMDNLEDKAIEYNWKINDDVFNHTSGSDKNKITLANNINNFVNKINISLEIINRERILQSLLRKEVSVNFSLPRNNEQQEFFSEGKFKTEAGLFDTF